MPRQKLPDASDMARFVEEWSRRYGAYAQIPAPLPSRGEPLQALKAQYQGWAAVQWVLQHAQRVDPEAVASLLKGDTVRAGNSVERRLWKERILYVTPLDAHYKFPSKVWRWVLHSGVAAGHFPVVVAPGASPSVRPIESAHHVVLASKPSVLIDRATRGSRGWDAESLQYRESFEGGATLSYFAEDTSTDTLRQELSLLEPRTSDVWRLLTAKALEQDRDDIFREVTLKPAELARSLGLKPHPNGSVRPKDLARCAKSVAHLERLWRVLPDATPEYEEGSRVRVLAVMARGRARMIDGVSVPDSWTIALGRWAAYFPRTFAPIFRSLVELPANTRTNVWAKQIGTELSYWFREMSDNESSMRWISVGVLLRRSSVVDVVEDFRERGNLDRVVERFESSMDLLTKLGLLERWNYEAQSASKLDFARNKAEFYETWLASVVELQVPEQVLASIAALASEERMSLRTAPDA